VGKDEDEPGWAPLRDTYMLGSKLKDWDKMQVMSSDLLLKLHQQNKLVICASANTLPVVGSNCSLLRCVRAGYC
jgi:hypothetical protein